MAITLTKTAIQYRINLNIDILIDVFYIQSVIPPINVNPGLEKLQQSNYNH